MEGARPYTHILSRCRSRCRLLRCCEMDHTVDIMTTGQYTLSWCEGEWLVRCVCAVAAHTH